MVLQEQMKIGDGSGSILELDMGLVTMNWNAAFVKHIFIGVLQCNTFCLLTFLSQIPLTLKPVITRKQARSDTRTNPLPTNTVRPSSMWVLDSSNRLFYEKINLLNFLNFYSCCNKQL